MRRQDCEGSDRLTDVTEVRFGCELLTKLIWRLSVAATARHKPVLPIRTSVTTQSPEPAGSDDNYTEIYPPLPAKLDLYGQI